MTASRFGPLHILRKFYTTTSPNQDKRNKFHTLRFVIKSNTNGMFVELYTCELTNIKWRCYENKN